MRRWQLVCVAALAVACGAEPTRGSLPQPTVVTAPASAMNAAAVEESAAPAEGDPTEAEREMLAEVLQPGDDWNPPGILEVTVTAGADGLLDVGGRARDLSDVSQFAQRANESPMLRDVVVHRIEASAKENGHAFHLRMRCTGRHLCAPQDVQRIWLSTIVPLPKEDLTPESPFPVPHTMKLVGIVRVNAPRVLLVDDDGFGWIVRLGDTKGGEELVRIGSDNAVFRSVADGKEHTLRLAP